METVRKRFTFPHFCSKVKESAERLPTQEPKKEMCAMPEFPPIDLPEEDPDDAALQALFAMDQALTEMDKALAEINYLLHLMLFLTELAASELILDRGVLQDMLDRLLDKIDHIADTL